MPLPSKYSIAHAVVVGAGGHPVRPVDASGAALDDPTQIYSIAHPVLVTDINGIASTDSTKVVSNPRLVTVSPLGIPVVNVDSTGATLGTSLSGGPATLNVLTLSNYSFAENSAPGFVIANIIGTSAGSALSLSDSAGSKVALSGTQLIVGATNTDYETTATFPFTVVETLAGAVGTPKSTTITLTVNNVFEQPSLGVLTFSSTSWTNGVSSSGTITGATSGSTLAISGGPTGLTINSAARTWAFDGTGAAGSGSFTLTQTLVDSANSPHSDTISYTIAAGSGISAPVLSNFASDGTWDTAYDATDTTGLIYRIQAYDDSGLSTLRQDLYKQLAEGDMALQLASWASTADPPPRDYTTNVITGENFGVGARWLRARFERDDGVVSAWSNTVTATMVSSTASTQWRLNVAGTQATSYFALAEIVFRQTIGDGASVVSATSCVSNNGAPSWDATDTASKAIDGNATTNCFVDGPAPFILTFTFGSAVGINEILVTSVGSSEAGNGTACMSNFTWERWNGSSWVTGFSGNGAGVGSWTDGITRTFH